MNPDDGDPEAHRPLNTGLEDQTSPNHAHAQNYKFRFKSSKRKSTNDESRQSSAHSDGYHNRHYRTHQHHRNKRRKPSKPSDDPALYDDTYLPNTSTEQFLDPDTAFRESLFDAMADDEGAQFWEGVYGQPIPKKVPVKEGPTGELESMTEDEYAAHIRAEMYKKTHQYLFEERARREQARKDRERLAEEACREEAATKQFRRVVDESLRKGRERKERAHRATQWADKWDSYEKAWNELGDRCGSGAAKIPWPVWQGKREDICKEEIETFFLNGPTLGKPEQAELLRTLKAERVRWHPDKIQQKLGGHGIDEVQMQAVTAVFQIIDRMWSEIRNGKS